MSSLALTECCPALSSHSVYEGSTSTISVNDVLTVLSSHCNGGLVDDPAVRKSECRKLKLKLFQVLLQHRKGKIFFYI